MAEVDHFLFSLFLYHKVINICQNRYKKLVSNPSSLTMVTHTATSSTFPSPHLWGFLFLSNWLWSILKAERLSYSCWGRNRGFGDRTPLC